MFLLDDLLMLPIRGLLWSVRKLDEAARQELAAEEGRIVGELSDLYRLLEGGAITEEEFAAREKVLLDRLEKFQKPEEEAGTGEEAQAAAPTS
jgi:hypothetical protein